MAQPIPLEIPPRNPRAELRWWRQHTVFAPAWIPELLCLTCATL
jgi:hypothetical protein